MASRWRPKRITGWSRPKIAAKASWPSTRNARRISKANSSKANSSKANSSKANSSKANSMSSPQRPDIAELLARAREIAGIARERARETEAARRVSDDMIARMRQADLFRIMQPRAYGGFEYGFDVFVQVQM